VLIPVGLDETRLNRWPWVSIAILVTCILSFLASSFSSGEKAAEARLTEVVRYWTAHPYLELPPEMERYLGVSRDRLDRFVGQRSAGARPPSEPLLSTEQRQLDALCADLMAAYESIPERRFSLVPERGFLQVGWLTHIFMHGGLGHILGNMIVFFLVVGPFLEDVWGRPFFLAFYLVGGLLSGACQALPMGDSPIHILGASGAISACLGAFALRFAHRRVRIFYWFFLIVRGTFFVPVWAYALIGASLDLLGLKLSGTGGGVAYAAHVGGLFFGIGVAAGVRATRLEERIAPEGAVRWKGSLGVARAADALAEGRSGDARRMFEEALSKDPDDEEAVLGLARLDAVAFDRGAANARIDRLLGKRLGAGDAEGTRSLLAEFRPSLDPARLRPATAYRASELVQDSDPELAVELQVAASAAGGALGAKALLRAAALLCRKEPARARELAERVVAGEGVPPELVARARELAAQLPRPEPAAGAAPESERLVLDPSEPVTIVYLQLVGAGPEGLDLVAADGRRARLAPGRVEALAVGLVGEFTQDGTTRRNAVVADLVLHRRAGEGRMVLRLLGHSMALDAIRPGVPPQQAFSEIVEGLIASSGATAVPGPASTAGRPFARFADTAAFEMACYARALTPPVPVPA
jgi:membrane associated rhomboid family serine protease